MLTNLTLKTGTLTDNYQAQKRMQMPNWETVMRRFIVALLFSTFFTTPASADFSDAMSAFEAGRYVTAAREFRRLAQQGDADAQFMLGYAYALGEGVLQDYVQAHMWFNLAAAAGKSEARGSRSGVERKMTPLQIAEAQRLAREWRPTTPAEAPRTTEIARAKPE
ncbi:MAG: sel1 repeat family protein, partial [Proteobacteria bacterium]|nr:sel1 repeat family protein [Pseudomonadota bacterium]